MDTACRLPPIWRVDSRKRFTHESIGHLSRLPDIQHLREILEPVLLDYPSLASIYVRGSVLEEVDQNRVRDVDVVCISEGRLSADVEYSVTRDMAEQFVHKEKPLDLRFVTLRELEIRPVRSASTLGIIYRSLPLYPWLDISFAFDVQASQELAFRLAATEMKEIGAILRRHTLEPFEPRRVEWLQKRALRLGGIASLLTSTSYSRHLPTCVSLGTEAVPEIGMTIGHVWNDFVQHQLTSTAFWHARELILGWADVFDKHVRQSIVPIDAQ